MSYKYSVILCTLNSDGADVWETPHEILEKVAEFGYDGVDLDAEPDKIPMEEIQRSTRHCGVVRAESTGR